AAAAAQRNSVPYLVAVAIGRNDRNPAADPQRAVDLRARINHEANGGLETRLHVRAAGIVHRHQAAAGTVAGLVEELDARPLLVGVLDQVPDLTGRVAEAGEGA